MATQLRNAGHQVAEAVDGEQGLRLFEAGDFDLVVTDLEMPEVDGMDLLKGVQASKRDSAVLLVSGARSDALCELARKLGAANFLEKPLSADSLLDEVGRILEARAT